MAFVGSGAAGGSNMDDVMDSLAWSDEGLRFPSAVVTCSLTMVERSLRMKDLRSSELRLRASTMELLASSIFCNLASAVRLDVAMAPISRWSEATVLLRLARLAWRAWTSFCWWMKGGAGSYNDCWYDAVD